MFLLAVFTWPAVAQEVQKEDTMDRIELCRKNYTALFGGDALTGTGTDPELMALEPMLSRNIIKLQITDNHILSKAQSKSKSF